MARRESACCGPGASCCGAPADADQVARRLGYAEEDVQSVPGGADLGLDCFIAARRAKKVIGVDMTPEMLDRARAGAKEAGFSNVEFRLGEIEHLPVADASADIVISNCVINLSPDKRSVFNEAYRVLRPGGRVVVSDIVLTRDLPVPVRQSAEALVGCVAGALLKEEYLQAIRDAGFIGLEVLQEQSFPLDGLSCGAAPGIN